MISPPPLGEGLGVGVRSLRVRSLRAYRRDLEQIEFFPPLPLGEGLGERVRSLRVHSMGPADCGADLFDKLKFVGLSD